MYNLQKKKIQALFQWSGKYQDFDQENFDENLFI